jgi:hypothetical protein
VAKELKMLTQQAVQERLNRIADELSRAPGMYYELYSRLFSERINFWIHTAPRTEATMIERVAQNDPDYTADIEPESALQSPYGAALFNPAWDVQYQ